MVPPASAPVVTGFPYRSWIVTFGCVENTLPDAPATGDGANASCDAAPGCVVNVPVVADSVNPVVESNTVTVSVDVFAHAFWIVTPDTVTRPVVGS